ncbi:hypothetical protein ACWD5B_22920 [Streptomyces tanashiensis]
MTVDEVVGAAERVDQTEVSDGARDYAAFSPTWKIEVHRRGVPSSPPAVTAYESQAVGLFCIAADAVQGPQVAFDRHTEWDSMPSDERHVKGETMA